MMKLINYKLKSISRGSVFRLPAVWPYEEWVDFMVVDMSDSHALVVSSGQKAGLILINLPSESNSEEGRALSTAWVIDNWSKWIYPETSINDVYIMESYVSRPIDN